MIFIPGFEYWAISYRENIKYHHSVDLVPADGEGIHQTVHVRGLRKTE